MHVRNSLPCVNSIQNLGFAGEGSLRDSGNMKKRLKSKVILLFPDKACVCAFALGVEKGEWSVLHP